MGSATPTVACCTHLHSLFARVEQRLLQCQISRRLVALPMLKNLPHTCTHTLYTLSLPLSLSLSFPLPSLRGLRHVCAKQTVCHRDEQTPELIGQKQKLLCLDWIDNDSSLVAQLPGCIPVPPSMLLCCCSNWVLNWFDNKLNMYNTKRSVGYAHPFHVFNLNSQSDLESSARLSLSLSLSLCSLGF